MEDAMNRRALLAAMASAPWAGLAHAREDTMITVRKSHDRGQVDLGWLKSHHSFSALPLPRPRPHGLRTPARHQPRRGPGWRGLLPHGHRNMEIISYVLDGVLAHEDSTGNRGVIRPGEVQVMSAGSASATAR